MAVERNRRTCLLRLTTLVNAACLHYKTPRSSRHNGRYGSVAFNLHGLE